MLDEFFSSLDQAKYSVIHDYNKDHPNPAKRGPRGLAAVLGKSPNVISNKVNPQMESHGLMVDEAVLVQKVAKDYRILYAESAELDHVCFPLGDFTNVSDLELLRIYTRFHKELGEFAAEFNDALDDGEITREEFTRIDKEMHEAVQALFGVRKRIESLVVDD